METPSVLPKPKDVDCSRKRKTKCRVCLYPSAKQPHRAGVCGSRMVAGDSGQYRAGSPHVPLPRRGATKPGHSWARGSRRKLEKKRVSTDKTRLGSWLGCHHRARGWGEGGRDDIFPGNRVTVLLAPSVRLEGGCPLPPA